MHTITSSQRRWIMIGTVIGVLVIFMLVFKEPLWNTIHPLIATFATQDGQPEQSVDTTENMNRSSPPEMGTGQAYAMVKPAHQQLIGVKTDVVDMQTLQTVIRAVGRVGV